MEVLILEHLRDFAETAALVCAAVYFGYKTRIGYFRVDLSLSVECSRQHLSEAEDYLVICAKLAKGPNGSLTLHDAQARVSFSDSTCILTFPGIERSSYVDIPAPYSRKAIEWGHVSATSPLLKIVPGESTEIAIYRKVPRREVCTVEVAIFGQRTNKERYGQWKASCVSLPTPV